MFTKKIDKIKHFPTTKPRRQSKRHEEEAEEESLVLEVAACQPRPIKSGTAPIFLQVVIQATRRSGSTLVKNTFLPFPGADPENSERGGRDTCPLASYIDLFFSFF